MNFDEAFDRVLGFESGYVNDPADPGGETNWGISKASYPALNIRALTRDDAKAIYLRDFWNRIHADQLHAAVAFQAFDFAVNSGIETSIRALQRALGVPDDGHWGPVTAKAEFTMADEYIVMLFVAERLDFWRSLLTWSRFGRGWAGRAAQDLRYGAMDT
jgi:lysozyme family protein